MLVLGALLALLLVFIVATMVFLVISAKKRIERIGWKRAESGFSRKNGYSYDVVVVMPVYGADEKLSAVQRQYSHEFIVRALSNAGLETHMFYSQQQDEVYIKVRASLRRLQLHAAKTEYLMELNPQEVQQCIEAGAKDESGSWKWLPMKILDIKSQSRFEPHQHVYGKYSLDAEKQALFHNRALPAGVIFRGTDRIKLITSIIQSRVGDNGSELPLRKLQQQGVLLGYFPLHDHKELAVLKHDWLQIFQLPNQQPFDGIRNYFGEKIALYFGWLGIYTNFLSFAAAAGLFFWLVQVILGEGQNSNILIGFAAFMALWSTAYLEKWRDKEVRYAMSWGMTDFEEQEEDRVEFYGELTSSPIDGKPYMYFPHEERAQLFAKSRSVIVACLIAVLGIIAGVMTLDVFLSGGKVDGEQTNDEPTTSGYHIGSIIAFFINAIFIQIAGDMFSNVARRLTDDENHRTDTDYEDSLVRKSFVFHFINSYTSLFYIAFFARLFGQHCNGSNDNCMAALNSALGTIFCTRLIISNFFEVALPALRIYKKTQENTVSDDERHQLEASIDSLVGGSVGGLESGPMAASSSLLDGTAAEEQFMLDEYDIHNELFDDYLEMVVQFGYATLFSTSFTLAPVLALVNNYVEIRVDAWKITCNSRRPLPTGAQDVGQWQNLMEFMAVLQASTNAATLCFSSQLPVLRGASNTDRIVIFLIAEHTVLLLKAAVRFAFGDLPPDVVLQNQRAERINARIIDQKADEESDILEYTGEVPEHPPSLAEYTIHAGDTEWKEKKK